MNLALEIKFIDYYGGKKVCVYKTEEMKSVIVADTFEQVGAELFDRFPSASLDDLTRIEAFRENSMGISWKTTI